LTYFALVLCTPVYIILVLSYCLNLCFW